MNDGEAMLHQLAARIRAGDERAFEQLFRELHAPLCEVVDSYVRSQDVAEELVQDLFFVVWTKRATLEFTGSLRSYLFSAARNRALQHLRHRAIVRRVARDAAEDASTSSMGQPSARADRALEIAETRRALQNALARLPDRSRLAFVLRQEYRMSYAEVADAMGISVKGVEKLLSIAGRKLREQLGALANDLALPAE